MTNPDVAVRNNGEEVTHYWIETPVYDAGDRLDHDASTIGSGTINAILSNPTEEELEMMAGRSATAALTATVPSDTDIKTDREGWPDEITARGRTYRVVEIIEDRHPFAKGFDKMKALLEHSPAESQTLAGNP